MCYTHFSAPAVAPQAAAQDVDTLADVDLDAFAWLDALDDAEVDEQLGMVPAVADESASGDSSQIKAEGEPRGRSGGGRQACRRRGRLCGAR